MGVETQITQQSAAAGAALAETEIDEIAKRQRYHQDGAGAQAQQQEGEGDLAAIGAQERPQFPQRGEAAGRGDRGGRGNNRSFDSDWERILA